MAELRCSLSGTPFVLQADVRLLEAVALTLAPLRTRDPLPNGFVCEARIGVPESVESDARVHFKGTPFHADGPCVLGERRGERFLILPERLSVVASLARREAQIVVAPGEESCLNGVALMSLIDWVLEADARVLVHGAALAVPKGDRGVLLVAPSGGGKTTLALAMLKAGFHLFSDDLAVVEHAKGQAWVGGLQRTAKVHRNTKVLMPWLVELLDDQWDACDEQFLSVESAARIGRLADCPVQLSAIFRIAERSAGLPGLRPVSESEMLMHLSVENVRIGLCGVPDSERRAFRRLGAIVSGPRSYDLVVGVDIASVPPLIVNVIR